MVNPLSLIFLDTVFDISYQKIWDSATFSFLQKKEIHENHFNDLLKDLLRCEVSSLNDKKKFFHKFISFLILANNNYDYLKDPFFERVLKKSKIISDNSTQILLIFKCFINHLLKNELIKINPSQLPSGFGLFEEGKLQKKGFLPSLDINNELSVLWIVLGNIHNNSLKQSGINLARWNLTCMDSYFRPFYSLWTNENDTSEINTLCSHYLLLDVLSFFYESSNIELICDKIYRNIERKMKTSSLSIDIFYVLLMDWVRKNIIKPKTKQHFFDKFENIFVDPYCAFLRHNSKKLSTTFTLSGSNSSLGSIYTKDVSIPTFGPQFFPLGDSKSFGIERLLYQENSLNDVDCKINRDKGSINGWSPLFYSSLDKKSDSIWMKFNGNTYENKCDFSINIPQQDLSSPCAIIFYIKAKECIPEGCKPIRPNTLNQYAGPAKKLEVKGLESTLELNAKSDRMHIIPLSGGNCFWESDFLLAYEIGFSNDYKIEITSV